MIFQDKWDTVPALKDSSPEIYKALQNAVSQIEHPGKCVLYHDFETDSIILKVEGNRGTIGLVIYNTYEYMGGMAEGHIKEDIARVLELEHRANRLVLEYIYEFYEKEGTWPTEISVLINNRKLGSINEILEDLISKGFARTWHPGRKNAFSTLSIKGLSLCMKKGARQLTHNYLRVVNSLADFFINDPQSDYVTWTQIAKKTGIVEEKWNFIFTLLYNEEEVFPRNPDEKSGKVWLDKDILRFEKIKSINEYFRNSHQILDAKRPAVHKPASHVIHTGVGDTEDGNKLEYDVFISYSSKDQTVTDEIYRLLEEEGIKPFLAPKDIDSARKGPQSIKEALRNSKEILFLMSPNSRKSDWVLTEWGASWVLDKPVTPILLNCEVADIPDLLKEWQKRDYPDEIQRYIEEVKKRLHES